MITLNNTKEKNDVKYAKMFREFSQAFGREIRALEKTPPSVKVKNIEYIGKRNEMFYYDGIMAEPKAILSDTPCALTPDNSIASYDVRIVDADREKLRICSFDKIDDFSGMATLHIGEKVLIQELARCLVEHKTKCCDAGERAFGCGVTRIHEYTDEVLYLSHHLSETGIAAVRSAMENDVTFINIPLKDDANTVLHYELSASILYNLFVKNRRTLYLANDNKTVDNVMSKVIEISKEKNDGFLYKNDIGLYRAGFTIGENMPEEALPESHAKKRMPEAVARKEELDAELFQEDIDKIQHMLRKEKDAKENIARQKGVIEEMKRVIEKTERQIDDYDAENVLKKNLLISKDFKIDKDIVIKKAYNKIESARETIYKDRKYIDMVEASKQYFDKELKLLSLRESIRNNQTKLLKEARVIGTTATISFLDEDIRKNRFDTVVVDQASEIWIPILWQAGYLAMKNIVLIGDMTRNPSVVSGKGKMVAKWLGTSLFNSTGILRQMESRNGPENMYSL